ncbi:MAG: hypothetical protein IJ469_00870 [Candidatus Methanomethylophilaceae archaeon]|nr:hypothetical protein [Candidatus Methanomethylophilaceae archaeon]
MYKTKTIAIAVVAIIIVAAAAIVVTSGSGDDDVVIESQLKVFGNADGDYDVDAEDLQIINRITSGIYDSDEYPMADANYDGVVNGKDRDVVQKIINGEPCTVYHYNTCTTGDYVVSTKWPVKAAVSTAASNMLWISQMAGMSDMIYGISYSKSSPPDPTLFPRFSEMPSIGSSSTKMPIENTTSYIKDYGVTAVLCDKTASTVDTGTVEQQYEQMGIDVIRVNPALVDANEYSSEMFLLAFLFQTDDRCKDVAEWWIGLQDKIESKLEGVKDKKTVIACNGVPSGNGMWLSAGTSDYKQVVEKAGGIYALGDEVLTQYTSGCYFNWNDTWLYNYDIDCIINIKTNDWYSCTVDEKAKYDECLGIFAQTQAYKNGDAAVVVGDAPIPLRILYSAVALYPDLFSEDWADEMHKVFFDRFVPGNTVDWDNAFFMLTYDMVY